MKPKSGELITASYFHLVPLINIEEVPGEIVSFLSYSQNLVINNIVSQNGIEPRFFRVSETLINSKL